MTRALSAKLWAGLQKLFGEEVMLNGPPIGPQRLCSNLSLFFRQVEADSLLAYLDRSGVDCSSGSACNSGTGEARLTT